MSGKEDCWSKTDYIYCKASSLGTDGGCKTVDGRDCVFPFTYRGLSYSSCTTAESVNGAAWCATEVDSSGAVVHSKWQDCEPECPVH